MAIISTSDAAVEGCPSGLKRAVFTYSADTEVVAGVTGSKVVVYGIMCNSAAASNSTFTLDDGGTVIFGPLSVGILLNVVIPPTSTPLCETSSGGGLDINLSATDATAGTIWYAVVTA